MDGPPAVHLDQRKALSKGVAAMEGKLPAVIPQVPFSLGELQAQLILEFPFLATEQGWLVSKLQRLREKWLRDLLLSKFHFWLLEWNVVLL